MSKKSALEKSNWLASDSYFSKGRLLRLTWFTSKLADVLLGLEWLTMHHATIDCPRRKVTFQKPGTKPFSLQFRQVGDRITTISALQAQHLIESGCTAYLVSAMQTKSGVKNLSSIPVVSELTDVFHETLPGLPPEREVDLCIETKQATDGATSAKEKP